MNEAAARILEQFRSLSPEERREVLKALLHEAPVVSPAPQRRRSVAELRTFVPTECPDVKDHDRWWAEAILASKTDKAIE